MRLWPAAASPDSVVKPPAASAEPPASLWGQLAAASCVLSAPLQHWVGSQPPPIPHVCLELHMVRVALRAGGPWLRHHEMCSKQAHPGRP